MCCKKLNQTMFSTSISVVEEVNIVSADRRADLHVHTNASDGIDSAHELVRKAANAGLSAIAITDHDTVKSVAAAMKAGVAHGVEVIPGAEFSVCYEPVMHILGLYIDTSNQDLAQQLKRMDRVRVKLIARAFRIVNEYGISIAPQEILKTHGAITLVNVCAYLYELGMMQMHPELISHFENFLMEWKGVMPTPATCIARIHACGGVAILAHPKLLMKTEKELKRLIFDMKCEGLDGIEVIHPSHDAFTRRLYSSWANEMGLLESGGSDYHGKQERNSIGDDHVPSCFSIPYVCLQDMKNRCRGWG